VATILQRTAEDSAGTRGCRRCSPGHDPYTGWGVLNVEAAVDSLPEPAPADWREPNDDAGARARWVWGPRQRIVATLDFWNDPVDVYRIRLRRGQRVRVVMRGLRSAETRFGLWRPGTKRLRELPDNSRRLAAIADEGPEERVIRYRATRTGNYFLEVSLSSPIPATRYELRLVKSRIGARRPGRTG
jgi:hypothetical protein